MTTPLEKIKLASQNFTKTDDMIYEFITTHTYDVVHCNILEIAKAAKVSKSALLRFTQKIGYSGFSEFKYEFSRYVHSGTAHEMKKESPDRLHEIVSVYQQTIGFLINTLDDDKLNQIVEAMISARRIKIFGVNRTGFAAQQLRHRFHKIDFDGEAVTDYILIPEISAQGHSDDIHMYFSTTGNTIYMIDGIRNSREKGIRTILISMSDKSKMTPYADIVITLPTTKMFMSDYFLDLQAINFIFIEILISYLGERLSAKS